MYPKVSFGGFVLAGVENRIRKKAFPYHHLDFSALIFLMGTALAQANSGAFHFTIRGTLPLTVFEPLVDGRAGLRRRRMIGGGAYVQS